MVSVGNITRGIAAGAVGTVALNIATYVDMLLRGRSPSDVPTKVAGKLADEAGVNLAGTSESDDSNEAEQKGSNRRNALGALLGYVTGLGIGAAYGLGRPSLRSPHPVVSGVVLGAAAMAGSDVPATLLGATDPRRWGAKGWAADIVPHLSYGFFTAVAYQAFGNGRE